MIHLERSILVFLSVWAVACAVYWIAGIVRFINTRLSAPLATDAEKMPDLSQWPLLCVVVPAHNEEGSIGALLATLQRQDYPADRLKVVFSLDRCTDGTERVLREQIGGDGRFSIHTIDHCPPEWAGKVHALWHAVMNRPEAFDADLLLFIDADTLLHPSCVRWAVKLREARGCGLLSLYSTLAKRFWFEHVVQPAAAGELLRQYPVLRANESATSRSMANGQFMLFTRETYFRVGTHRCVQNEVLEDTALAQMVKGVGRKVEVLFADGALVCRMYDTWGAFVQGWKRLYIELANRRPERMAAHAWTALCTGALMPVFSLCAVVAALVVAWDEGLRWYTVAALICGGAGLLGFYGCMLLGVVWGGASAIGAVLYPVGSAFVAWILRAARRDLLAGVPIRWGGKEYVRQPRRRGDGVPVRSQPPVVHDVPPRGSLAGAAVVVRPLDGASAARG
ncbi:MAG TPA: glycosyltransferase family 2 protein [Phycisphaerales bacterium]|nr:glycosyltransferase family 2 protein [Phycisphaerales bacterium]